MRGTGVPVEGVLMNRVRLWPGEGDVPACLRGNGVDPRDVEALARALTTSSRGTTGLADGLAAARTAVELAKRYASLVQLDQQSAAPLREHAARNDQIFGVIPELSRDVHDTSGLACIGDALFRHGVGLRAS